MVSGPAGPAAEVLMIRSNSTELEAVVSLAGTLREGRELEASGAGPRAGFVLVISLAIVLVSQGSRVDEFSRESSPAAGAVVSRPRTAPTGVSEERGDDEKTGKAHSRGTEGNDGREVSRGRDVRPVLRGGSHSQVPETSEVRVSGRIAGISPSPEVLTRGADVSRGGRSLVNTTLVVES